MFQQHNRLLNRSRKNMIISSLLLAFCAACSPVDTTSTVAGFPTIARTGERDSVEESTTEISTVLRGSSSNITVLASATDSGASALTAQPSFENSSNTQSTFEPTKASLNPDQTLSAASPLAEFSLADQVGITLPPTTSDKSSDALKIETVVSQPPVGSSTASSSGPAIAPQSATNRISIRTPATGATSIAPVQFARVFKKGEIAATPELFAAGIDTTAQQVTVKSRWPDGSAKHAIFAVALPWNSNSVYGFRNKANQGPEDNFLSIAKMQILLSGFDVQIDVKSSTGVKVSTKLSSLVASGALDRVWINGPQMVQFVLADHSAARKFDFGFDSNKSLRPLFHVTVWPTLNLVKARVILENSNAEALQDINYSVDVYTSTGGSTSAYSESNVTHVLGSRWTREYSNKPVSIASINHNLAYLKDTFAFANYDTNVQIPSATVQEWVGRWNAAPKGLYAAGNWIKYMPTTGGRADIGLLPTWTLLWLYTGDNGLYQMTYGNAELAMSWPVHFRESKSTVLFDQKRNIAGLGRTITADSRPSLYLATGNVFVNYNYTTPADKLKIVGPNSTGNGWYPDMSHQPDPFSALYTVNGDFWLLEQMWFWSGWNIFQTANGGAQRFDSRGPFANSAGISDQTRGDAWGIRSRATTAFLSPDNSDEKLYFERITNEAINLWEGTRAVAAKNTTSAEYKWGYQFASQRNRVYGNVDFQPMNFWDYGNDRVLQGIGYDPVAIKAGVSPWQQNFLIVSLGRAGEMGFDVGALMKWNAKQFESALNTSTVAPWLLGAYAIPLVDSKSGGFYPNWQGTVAAMGSVAQTAEREFKNWVPNLDSGYPQFASAASAFLTSYYSSSLPENFFRDNVRNVSNYSTNPKWNILPR
jgi:hypothetical protein